ncbi:hypothetical protein [Ideonella sp. A 288]|uniref:hypothetical protein n=1 Tax=Ideonella sp. A 288 TaxID=1962181 RepID=UPI000B4B090F|nr:hypothetical protein [Ideonella sp. A 288]
MHPYPFVPARLRLSLLATAAITALASSHLANAAEVTNSTFDIDVVASRISVKSLQGSSSNSNLFGLFGSKKSTPALVGRVYAGYVSVEQGARVNNVNVRVRAVVDSIHSNGGDVCIACQVFK